jgi:pimeloyl-ACP methyl ester carboxylesterase
LSGKRDTILRVPHIEMDGRRLFYSHSQSHGNDLVLLLLHGAGGSHLIWPQALRQLPGHRVIALDLPGHGRSDGWGRRLVSHYAAAVMAFTQALNISEVIVIGHSLGGAIALDLAYNFPETIRGLVGIGVAARMRVGPALLQAWLKSPEKATAFINSHGFFTGDIKLHNLNRAQFQAAGPVTTYGDFLACNHFDCRSSLVKVPVPALILSGSADRLIPPLYAEALATGLPRGRFTRLEAAGHYAMLERADEVASLVIDFIGEIGNRI